MFAPTAYLNWARQYYGKVRYDLATSGIPAVPLDELGMPGGAQSDDPCGWHLLREAVAKYNAVSTAEVVATLGASHALWLTYASLLAPGDGVLIEHPAYEPLLRAAESVGAYVSRFARDASRGFALDPAAIARAMTPRTRLVVITNLHNPTGVRSTAADILSVAEVAQAHGAFVLVDEVYAPFDSLVGPDGIFGGSARPIAANVIAISSLTKCYGLASARVGWVLAPPEVIRIAEDGLTTSCGMLPLFHAHLGVRAFARIGWLAERSRLLNDSKRGHVDTWVAREGLQWSAPAAGLFGLATLRGAGDLTAAIEAGAREHEVLVAAGSFFGVPNGFRLAWSAPTGILQEGLERLSKVLSAARLAHP